MSEKLIVLEDFVLSLAEERPDWVAEDSLFRIINCNTRYFIIDEVAAARLESLRKLIPIIIEERRKLT